MFQRLVSQILLPVLIVAIGAGGLVWLSTRDAPPERVAQQPSPLLVETIPLQASASSFPIHVGGNVVPRREVTLSAEVDGAVTFKGDSIESGRHVRQGTPLIQIDPARYELLLGQLDSELQQVDADLQRLVTEEQGTVSLIKLAEREAEIATAASTRLKGLALKNAATDADLEAVERTELQARNVLTVLLNQHTLIPVQRQRLQAQHMLTTLKQQQAQLNLDRTEIVAPFTGVITVVDVEQGNYVQTGDMLLKLEDTSAVDVECSLRMDDLYWLWNSHAGSDEVAVAESAHGELVDPVNIDVGKPFEIPAVDALVVGEVAGRQFHWNGRLSRYEGRGVNQKTRTVSCRVAVSEPIREDAADGPPTLMRGMYVTVTLNVTPRIRLLSIPTRGVQPNGQVWTVDNGLLRSHSVKAAKTLADSVLVRADTTDLKPGDRIVITQLSTPMDGSRVREAGTDRSAEAATPDASINGDDGSDGVDDGGGGAP
ncbi:MAG: HlyD family efflux transporter periplasmic adaptor subunit [Planctomycetota bacterium]|nr:HlyD family efflux transporter periplasmic adaptor subunit [Planctomycetota bacterium]